MPTCHKKALFELILYYHHSTCLRNAPKPLALIFQLRKNVTIKRLRYLSIPAQRNRDTEINFIQLNIRKWWRWLTTATYPMQTYFKSQKLSNLQWSIIFIQRSQFASDCFRVTRFDTSIQTDLSIRLSNRIQGENVRFEESDSSDWWMSELGHQSANSWLKIAKFIGNPRTMRDIVSPVCSPQSSLTTSNVNWTVYLGKVQCVVIVSIGLWFGEVQRSKKRWIFDQAVANPL